jgi:hypothetical protein
MVDLILIENLFSFPWNYGVTYGHILRALSCTSEWRIGSKVISKFDTDTASSWWRSQTSRGVRLSWSWTPSSLVLLHFFKLSHLGDLVTSRPAFNDEPETFCEGCYEIENTSIFVWFSVLGVGHYRWLHSPICRLPLNSKANYLVFTIQRILDFLQL